MKGSERFLTAVTVGGSVIVAGIAFFLVSRDARRSGPGEAWRYDVSRFRTVDPALLAYRETARIDLGFATARGLALDGSDRLVAVGDTALRIFDTNGVAIRHVALPGAPRCAAVGDTGEVYIGLGNRLAVWSPDTDALVFWPDFAEHALITGVAVHADNVFVADAGARTVSRHASDGARLAILAGPARLGEDGETVGLVVPSAHLDIAMAPDGLLRVVNPGRQRIEALTMDGKTEWAWGRASFGIEGFSGCCNPTDIAILSNGDIVTAEKGLPRIKVHRRLTGELLAVVAGPDAFDENAAGIDLAVDSQDRIVALDPIRGQAIVYEKL